MAPAQQPRPRAPGALEVLHSPSSTVAERAAAAGHLIRRHGIADGDRAAVDQALAQIAAPDLAAGLAAVSTEALCARLRRGAEEAFEVSFAEDEAERAMWTASAAEALRERDQIASLCAGAARWSERSKEGADPVGRALETLTAALAAADRDVRSTTRSFTAINAVRRGELEKLEPAARATAWWYADRADDDDLLPRLAGEAVPGQPSPRVAADLDASRLPARAGLAEAARIGADVDALIEEIEDLVLLELPKLELSGTARAMGRAHGEALRPLIERFVEVRFQATDVYLAERGVAAVSFLDEGRRCLAVAAEWDPEGTEEHLGIAEGACVDPARLYAATNMTDVRDILAYPAGDPGREGCSTLLVPGGRAASGEITAAQTWDLNPEDLEFVTAFHRRPTGGPETWSVTCAGALTLMGMNEHGLSVGTNNVKVTGGRSGVGYLGVLHRAIRCRSVTEATELVMHAPRAAAHVFWLAGPDRAVELECSQGRAVGRPLGDEPILRTNHCLDAEHRHHEGEPPTSTSTRRYARLETLLAGGERVDQNAIRAIFSDRQDGVDSICRLPEDGTGSATNACLVAVPARRELWACRGPAPRGSWTTLSFSNA